VGAGRRNKSIRLDVGEGLFGCCRIALANQANFNQLFVHFQPVFYEGDLEFFAAQAAAQGFQGLPGTLIGRVCLVNLAACGMNIPHQQVSLIVENRRLQVGKFFDRLLAMAVGLCRVLGPQRNPRQQELSKNHLVPQVERAKGFQRFGAKPTRLEEAALVVEHQSPVQVDQ